MLVFDFLCYHNNVKTGAYEATNFLACKRINYYEII